MNKAVAAVAKVLAPGTGKTKTGRLWTYVRDDQSAGSTDPPAVLFRYSPDRKGERPRQHLKDFCGILQADGYAGFQGLYDRERELLIEAACIAHARRKFFDLHAATASPIALEALERIGALYQIEAEEVRTRRCHRLHALALDRPHSILRRWTYRDRQQRRRARAARRCSWKEKLSFRRFRCRRRSRRCVL